VSGGIIQVGDLITELAVCEKLEAANAAKL
jgi:hypothetical protein